MVNAVHLEGRTLDDEKSPSSSSILQIPKNDEATKTSKTEPGKAAATHRSSSSFEEVHDEFCRSNGTLLASTQQAISSLSGQTLSWALPKASEVIVCTLPVHELTKRSSSSSSNHSEHCQEATRMAQRILDRNHFSSQSAESSSRSATSTVNPYNESSSSSQSTPSKVAGALRTSLSKVVGFVGGILPIQNTGDDSDFDDFDQEPAPWEQAEDNACAPAEAKKGTFTSSSAAAASGALDLSAPVVSVNLSLHCLNIIRKHVIQAEKHAIHDSSPAIIVHHTYWRDWVTETFSHDEILRSIETPSAELLLLLSIQANIAELVTQNNSGIDYVVLSIRAMKNQNLQTVTALYEIQGSIDATEKRLNVWRKELEVCQQKALTLKRSNKLNLALQELQKSKLLEQRINATSSALLNLEQVKISIENAQTNQESIKLLKMAAGTLKQIRLETDSSKEDIEQVQEELLIHSDSLNATTYEHARKTTDTDDEELLQELEALIIKDEDTITTNEEEKYSTILPVAPTAIPHQKEKQANGGADDSETQRMPTLA